ncbi:hypothetical protein CYQ88_09255 [Hydrogenovibrio sp. SC-1]|uniref:DUF6463 family protein n=1 Tax=Hydrogenovibrio sp. SC-1 TaxID=2065820 RepID=UPI000C7BF804|nr:DUF6463 family protein [Hydrogenovibrio sp. SC-1]PLA73798.1 hypothetical protein CYQ88_09255 [Hydrogenovibrio sp. SC-1]
MQTTNPRIHGRLLMATGIAHVILAILPGVFGDQFLDFSRSWFFNISSGAADFSFFDGTLNYVEFAAFWFFYAGPIMFLYGQAIDRIEKSEGYVSLTIAKTFIAVSLVGAYMVPLSGMTFVLLPQGIYMYVRSAKRQNM